jgi:hypothetical protein
MTGTSSGDGPAVTIRPCSDGFLVGVRVSPGAKTTRCVGHYGDRLKVRVAAPPESGRANSALLTAVARWLDRPKDTVAIHSGRSGRDKVLCFKGVSREELRRALAQLIVAAEDGGGS